MAHECTCGSKPDKELPDCRTCVHMSLEFNPGYKIMRFCDEKKFCKTGSKHKPTSPTRLYEVKGNE